MSASIHSVVAVEDVAGEEVPVGGAAAGGVGVAGAVLGGEVGVVVGVVIATGTALAGACLLGPETLGTWAWETGLTAATRRGLLGAPDRPATRAPFGAGAATARATARWAGLAAGSAAAGAAARTRETRAGRAVTCATRSG